MFRRMLLLGGLALLLSISTAISQPGGFPGGPPGGGQPPGPFQPPQPGQVLSPALQERLQLSAEQKKQLAELQKEVDAKLAKILTSEQQKRLKETPAGFGGGFGPPGGPGGFGPPGGFGGGFGPPGGFGGGFGPPGGPGGFGPGGFGSPRLEDVQKQLGASEEEWKVINPKLQKVSAARQVLNGNGGNPGAGPGPGGPFGGPGRGNIIAQAQTELKSALDDPKQSKEELGEKVAAVRKARQKARAGLETAQKDLLKLLTAKQEAVLVSLGLVD